MFIFALFVGKKQEQNKPTFSLEDGLKQWSLHSITAARFIFESAEVRGNRPGQQQRP
jgi:hypothetical protein